MTSRRVAEPGGLRSVVVFPFVAEYSTMKMQQYFQKALHVYAYRDSFSLFKFST